MVEQIQGMKGGSGRRSAGRKGREACKKELLDVRNERGEKREGCTNGEIPGCN